MRHKGRVLWAGIALVGTTWFLLAKTSSFRGPDRGGDALAPPEARAGSHAEEARFSPQVREGRAGTPALASGEAVLCLEVGSLGPRRPLEGVALARRIAGVRPGRLRSRMAWQGRLGDGLVTSPEGRAEYVVDAGRGYVLDVNWRKDPNMPSRDEIVPSLRPGERREMTIELQEALDRLWRASVLSADTRQPIAFAEVALISAASWDRQAVTSQLSSPAGSVAIRYSSWQGKHVRVSAPGYPTVLFPLAEQAPDSQAQELLLSPSAELDVLIVDSSGAPVPGAESSVAPGLSPPGTGIIQQSSFGAVALGDGHHRLEGLPSRVPLSLFLIHGGGRARRFPGELILEPRESRTLTWRLEPGCTVDGAVVDQAFAPVADQEIWLVVADSDNGYLGPGAGLPLKTTTDGAGRYSFPEVDRGWWRVGIAPGESTKLLHGAPLRAAYAPVAHAFHIDGDESRRTVDLVAWEGVFLRGRVFGAEGEPAAALVTAHGLDHDLHTRSGDDGSFELGPLEPVEYTIGAFLLEGSACPSETRVVQGGEAGVDLRLGGGATLRGRVLDELGRPVGRAELLCVSQAGFRALAAVESGAFEIPRLPPGTFMVLALLPDGGTALLDGVRLAPGESRGDLELEVVCGAALRISARGFEQGEELEYIASVRSQSLIRGIFHAGIETRVQVPPGVMRIEISKRHPDGTRAILLEEPISLAVGEERTLDLDARTFSATSGR